MGWLRRFMSAQYFKRLMSNLNIFNGHGMFVWVASDVFGGVPSLYASEAKRLGLTNVGFKIANGTADYNSDSLLFAIIPVLKAAGVAVWGWHYVYGYSPVAEANKAIERVNKFGLDAYVINAEAEYKEPGKATAAASFMTQLRAGLPDLPIGLSSYRYPDLHMQLPWREFLSKCDFNTPQVYWMLQHNPGWQLTESLRQFRVLEPKLGLAPLPYIPTGAAFKEAGWQPTAADLDEFDSKAKELELPGVLWYRWGHAVMLGFDDVIAKHIWETEDTQMEERIAALELLVAGLQTANAAQDKRLDHHGKLITEHHKKWAALEAALPADLAARLEALEAVHAAEQALLLLRMGAGE